MYNILHINTTTCRDHIKYQAVTKAFPDLAGLDVPLHCFRSVLKLKMGLACVALIEPNPSYIPALSF